MLKLINSMVRRGMQKDFSWEGAAVNYDVLYEDAMIFSPGRQKPIDGGYNGWEVSRTQGQLAIDRQQG